MVSIIHPDNQALYHLAHRAGCGLVFINVTDLLEIKSVAYGNPADPAVISVFSYFLSFGHEDPDH
jgi:hypothetical protein